jgi:hypothetical protein
VIGRLGGKSFAQDRHPLRIHQILDGCLGALGIDAIDQQDAVVGLLIGTRTRTGSLARSGCFCACSLPGARIPSAASRAIMSRMDLARWMRMAVFMSSSIRARKLPPSNYRSLPPIRNC